MPIDTPIIAVAITFVLHSTIAVSAVWLGQRFIRDPRARVLAWRAALIAPLLSTAFQLGAGYLPPLSWSLSSHAAVPAAAAAVADTGDVATASVRWSQLLAGLWALGAAFGLWRFSLTWLRTRRVLKGRQEVIDDAAVDALMELRRRAKIRRRIRLTASEELAAPIAHGRSEIVLSRHAVDQLPAPQLAAVIAHELAHLQHRDPIWLRVLAVVESFTFISPMSFVAARAHAEAVELAADDWARRFTGSGEALARALAEIAAHRENVGGVGHASNQAWVPGASGGKLVPRVERLLAPAATAPAERGMASVAGLLALVAGLALAAPAVHWGCSRGQAKRPAVPRKTVAKAYAVPAQRRGASACCGHAHGAQASMVISGGEGEPTIILRGQVPGVHAGGVHVHVPDIELDIDVDLDDLEGLADLADLADLAELAELGELAELAELAELGEVGERVELELRRAERDRAHAQRDLQRAERDRARAERDRARAERDEARAIRDRARAARERARAAGKRAQQTREKVEGLRRQSEQGIVAL